MVSSLGEEELGGSPQWFARDSLLACTPPFGQPRPSHHTSLRFYEAEAELHIASAACAQRPFCVGILTIEFASVISKNIVTT